MFAGGARPKHELTEKSGTLSVHELNFSYSLCYSTTSHSECVNDLCVTSGTTHFACCNSFNWVYAKFYGSFGSTGQISFFAHGFEVGVAFAVGARVGFREGTLFFLVGAAVGFFLVGAAVGFLVGAAVGFLVGAAVGFLVGIGFFFAFRLSTSVGRLFNLSSTEFWATVLKIIKSDQHEISREKAYRNLILGRVPRFAVSDLISQ
jgi:hypothetical protein